MTDALIRLDPPASLTPEVRAWIGQRRGVSLSRGRTEDGRPALLLRVRLDSPSRAGGPDEVEDLLTDLRLLGLRPSLVSTEARAAGGETVQPQAGRIAQTRSA